MFRLDTSGFEMELFSGVGAGRYVALGLSDDTSMGEDLVIVCGSVSHIDCLIEIFKLTSRVDDQG